MTTRLLFLTLLILAGGCEARVRTSIDQSPVRDEVANKDIMIESGPEQIGDNKFMVIRHWRTGARFLVVTTPSITRVPVVVPFTRQ